MLIDEQKLIKDKHVHDNSEEEIKLEILDKEASKKLTQNPNQKQTLTAK